MARDLEKQRAAAILGGAATKKKYGNAYYQEIGTLGGAATIARRGVEHFREMGRLSGVAKRARKVESAD